MISYSQKTSQKYSLACSHPIETLKPHITPIGIGLLQVCTFFSKYNGVHYGTPIKLTWVTPFIVTTILTLTKVLIHSLNYHQSWLLGWEQSFTHEDTRVTIDSNAMEDMCTTINELHSQNQTLEDNILNIQQR